ncbi:hypothetical protein IMSAG185_01918 [Lachnospiraceae bacterium]|jgi:transcriptional regulator with XRE-family HTH domain|nr:hypothetical protein IMSAG185_01918 [Lachnospiraceae bacterium]
MLMIAKIRKENGITQKQLAEASGLNVRWIQKLESGQINMENVTLLNIVRLLKGLNLLCTSTDVEEDYQSLRSAYVVVRELLK